jgi:hypothetical protein
MVASIALIAADQPGPAAYHAMKKRTKAQRSLAGSTRIQSAPTTLDGASEVAARPQKWQQMLQPGAGAILFFTSACLVCLVYTLVTNQVWEDSLITLRHSENLLKGEGLTFNTGGRVHGFTSPINVLLLVVCSWLSGKSSYVVTFWLYRALTIPAFAGSGVLLLKALDQTPPRWSAASCFLGIVYLFDVKSVGFSINGMETAFMLLFVAWAVYLMSRSQTDDQWLLRGLCWGGMMWTRPDGCVYIAAFSIAELIFLAKSRRATFVSLARSAALCAAIYAPWIVWASAYYGSPIPHTITAKADLEKGLLGQVWSLLENYLSTLIAQSGQAFRPIYYTAQATDWFGAEIWGQLHNVLTRIVGVVALLYFTYPVTDRFGRAMSLCFAILCTYFSFMSRAYPWYFPPAMMLGALAFTRAATSFALAAREGTLRSLGSRMRHAFVVTMFIVLAVGQILIFWPTLHMQRVSQAEVEDGNRTAIGKWLKENARATENVYLEPLGYIGYFSGLHMDDFPGLVSPEVVRIRRKLPPDMQPAGAYQLLVIPELKPDWVVLRRSEYELLRNSPLFEQFKKDYVLRHEFEISDKLAEYASLTAKGYHLYDAYFAVFHRNEPASP